MKRIFKKVKITILTNPLLISAEKIEYFIINTCKALGSIDRKKYKIDLHLLLWNSVSDSENYLSHIDFTEPEFGYKVLCKKYPDVCSIYDKITNFENIKKINVDDMIDVAKENIAKYPDTFSTFHFDNISYDFIRSDITDESGSRQENYGARYQFDVLTEDVRNSFDYDLYIYTSSNLRFLSNTEYIHEWIVNYEKYPKLPLYLNFNSWRYAGDSYGSHGEPTEFNLEEDSKINENTYFSLHGTAHHWAVRPQMFINFIEKDLFDDNVLEYIRTNVKKINIGSIIHETVINGEVVGDGIKIKNVREVPTDFMKPFIKPKHFKDKFPYVARMEPGRDFINHFFKIYMIKHGFKKFDIPLVDFGCIKIPICSLDGNKSPLSTKIYGSDDRVGNSLELPEEAIIRFEQLHELPNLIMTITNKIFEEIGISYKEIDNFIGVTTDIYKKHNESFGDDISLKEFDIYRNHNQSLEEFDEGVSSIYSEVRNLITEYKYEKNI